jgi:hypothetical protein
VRCPTKIVNSGDKAAPVSRRTISDRKLPVENDQLIPRSRQFSDEDRIPAQHVRRDLGWIIAGTQNDDSSARELLQETLEIAVSRDQDEAMRRSVFQNPPIATTGKPISKRALRFREKVA